MATRDLSYLLTFDVSDTQALDDAATSMDTLATATDKVSDEPKSLDLTLPEATDIEDVGTAMGDLGADGGPMDAASEKAGGLSGAFGTLVAALGTAQILSAGVEFALDTVHERLDFIAETDAWKEEQVEGYAAAIEDVGVGLGAIEQHLETVARGSFSDTSGLFGLGGGSEIENVAANLGLLGFTLEDLTTVVQGGEPELDAFRQRLDEVGFSSDNNSDLLEFATTQQEAYAQAAAEGRHEAEFFAESQTSANRALQEMLEQRDPMSSFTDEWDLLKESMSDGSIDTTAAANALNTLTSELGLTTEQVLELAQADLDEAAQGALDFATALNSIDFQATELQGATTAFSAYTDQLFAAANEAEAREAAFDALAASAENQALTFNLSTEAGRQQSDALEAVARVIDEDLAEAYDNANGSQDAFIATATQIGDETLARLQNELNLTDEQVETLRNTLGLTATDYEARFALAGAEQARLQLDLLSGAIEGLPDDVEVTVTQQILAGDFVGARDTVANYYADNPVPLPTEADTTGVQEGLAAATAPENIPPATIIADADTVQAADDLIATAAEPRTALIVAIANNQAAAAALESLVNQERTATIDAILGSYPTEAQIISKVTGGAGVIRIPVDTYLRHSVRIDGTSSVVR